MPTKRHLPFTHIIHAAGGQSNSALSQNFVHLESSARVHAADRAMRQSKYTWHRLVEKSACRRKFFIQLVTSLYLSRDHELSQSFHITPAVTLRAKALRPFGDGYRLGTLCGRRLSSSVVG
jgi:hypothetical protein